MADSESPVALIGVKIAGLDDWRGQTLARVGLVRASVGVSRLEGSVH